MTTERAEPAPERAPTRLRAYRVCLDPNTSQRRQLAEHAGQNRAAFNHALGVKVAAHREFIRIRADLAEQAGVDVQDSVAVKLFNAAARKVARDPGLYGDREGVDRSSWG